MLCRYRRLDYNHNAFYNCTPVFMAGFIFIVIVHNAPWQATRIKLCIHRDRLLTPPGINIFPERFFYYVVGYRGNADKKEQECHTISKPKPEAGGGCILCEVYPWQPD